MKVVAIIQARMGSSRLPCKVLKQVLGKPILTYQLERVSRSTYIDEIVVATTDNPVDDAIVDLCESSNVAYFKGPEDDVLTRFYLAATAANADTIVRLTGDCPIIDPEQIDQVIKSYMRDHKLDYASNTLTRTFPRGMDVEVMSFQCLQHTSQKAIASIDREHVTRYIRNHPEQFSLNNVVLNNDYSHHRWTVDTAEDFTLVKKIIETLYPQKPTFTMNDIIHLLNKHPDWQLINKHIIQKKD